MNYTILVGALELIVLLIAVVKPLLNLNTNITLLTASVNALKDGIEELKSRITAHGSEIDELRTKITEHDVRLKNLEK